MTQSGYFFCRCLMLLLLACLLAACTSINVSDGLRKDQAPDTAATDKVTAISQQPSQPGPQRPTRMTAQEMELSAINMPSPEKEYVLLYAVHEYIREGNLARASQLLNQANIATLKGDPGLRLQVLRVMVLLNQGYGSQAQVLLASLKNNNSTDPVFRDWRLEAEIEQAQASGEYLLALDLLNQRIANSDSSRAEFNQQRIWSIIRNLDLQTLEIASKANRDRMIQGWIELGMIDKQQGSFSSAQLDESIQSWRSAWPGHPGTKIADRLAGANLTPINPGLAKAYIRIGLLLPLSSAYSEIAQAIQDGFTAAAAYHGTPVEVYNTGPDITLINYQYQQAIHQGAQFVVGPLGKAAAKQLIQTTGIVKPTLLLGTVTRPDLPAQTYTYALDPEPEAVSVAQTAYQNGFRRAAILYPADNRGRRINTAFARAWKGLGGRISASIPYEPDINEANSIIDRLLKSMTVTPDIIFLASNAQQGRLLSQVLRNQNPGITVFATSSIYAGDPDPTIDFVLDEIRFPDMPWIIEGDSRTALRIQPSREKDYGGSLERFFAYGIDAYYLAVNLHQFTGHGGAMFNGVTGDIHLDESRFRLVRPFYRFSNGFPVPTNL